MLAEKLNITETAEALYLTQPALSKHLSYIEGEIGVRLFNRTTHSMELTEEGKIVYSELKKIIADYDALVAKMNSLKNETVGKLSLGVMYYAISEYVDPLVKRFQKDHNNIDISIRSSQPHQIFRDLNEGTIDLGMMIKFDAIHYKKFNMYSLGKEKSMVITRPDHPFTLKKSVTLADIANETLILLRLETEFCENIKYLLTKNKSLPKNIIYAEQIDLLSIALEKTNGVFIGQNLLKNMNRNDIAFSEIDSNVFDFEMCFAYLKKNMNPSIQMLFNTWEDLISEE